MCVVSAVMDYGQRQWPGLMQPTWTPLQPVVPQTTTDAERRALEAFRELVRNAEKFDREADQPHCEDPEKVKLLDRILQRLEVLEKRLGIED